MNPYFRAARSLLRFIATGLVLVGALLVALEVIDHRARKVDFDVSRLAGYAVMLLAGIILLFSAGRIAARLTSEDEEEDDTGPSDSGG